MLSFPFFFLRKGLLLNILIYLFIFVCPGSSLLRIDILCLWSVGYSLVVVCGLLPAGLLLLRSILPATREALLGAGFSNFGLWALQRGFSS